MPVLDDYRLTMLSLVKDGAEKLLPEDREEAIQQAVQEHNRIEPWVRVSGVSGSGSAVVSLPTGWHADFSAIRQIEYPVGQIPPRYLEPSAWVIRANPTAPGHGLQLLLLEANPGTAERLHVTWTAPHLVSDTTSSIPAGHYRAVATLAASYACLELAGFYAQAGDPTIGIDSQNPMTKSQEYRALAKEYRRRYRSFFGLGPEDQVADVVAASVSADLDRRTSWGGRFFIHHRRWS